jgi:hypothetical protein
MAICDLLVGIVCSTLQAFWFINSSLNGQVPKNVSLITFVITSLLVKVSLFHILALTIDRVIAVVDPVLYKSRIARKRVFVSVILIWVIIAVTEPLQIPMHKAFVIHRITGMILNSLACFAVLSLCLYISTQTS